MSKRGGGWWWCPRFSNHYKTKSYSQHKEMKNSDDNNYLNKKKTQTNNPFRFYNFSIINLINTLEIPKILKTL